MLTLLPVTTAVSAYAGATSNEHIASEAASVLINFLHIQNRSFFFIRAREKLASAIRGGNTAHRLTLVETPGKPVSAFAKALIATRKSQIPGTMSCSQNL